VVAAGLAAAEVAGVESLDTVLTSSDILKNFHSGAIRRAIQSKTRDCLLSVTKVGDRWLSRKLS
jgi:hypothetical protein